MAEEDELQDIKSILKQIRDQNAASATRNTVNATDVQQYTQELRLAKDELARLEEGTGAYRRKLNEVDGLTRQLKNSLKDQRDNSDSLTLATRGLAGAMDLLGGAIDGVAVKMTGLVKGLFEEVKQLDNLTVQFRAATGASSQLASNIGDLTDRLQVYGVSAEKANAAVNSLYSNFTRFSKLTEASQEQFGETVSLLAELGVSTEISAGIADTAMRALGMSVEQTNSLLIDMRGTSRELQIPMEQLTRDFKGAEDRIVAMGSAGPAAFNKLAAASKETGVEVSTLLGMVGQFETFEQGSSIAGKLNAILRTSSFNAQAIMMAALEGPKVQLQVLQDQFREAGIDAATAVDGLDYYTKKSLAGAIGVNITDLTKVLTSDLNSLDENLQEITYSLEDMKKEAFGLKGMDDVVNNFFKALKRPVSQVGQATRATFAGFETMIENFAKYNEGIIEQTTNFVANNSRLVGAIGILYNLGGVDGLQMGFEMFKGMASATGSILSGLFSIKGVLAVMIGGVLYSIRSRFDEIKDAFVGPQGGIFAGFSKIFEVLKDRFFSIRDMIVDAGFDKAFFMDILHKFKTMSIKAYSYFEVHYLDKFNEYLNTYGIWAFEQFSIRVGSLLMDAIYNVLPEDGFAAYFARSLEVGGIDAMFMDKDEIKAQRTGPRDLATIQKQYKESLPDDTTFEGREELRKRTLERRQSFIQASFDDRVASMHLKYSKGGQRIASEVAKVEKEAADAWVTAAPHIADAKKWTSEAASDAGGFLSELMGGLSKMIDEGIRGADAAHNELHATLVLDKEVLARAVSPIARKESHNLNAQAYGGVKKY